MRINITFVILILILFISPLSKVEADFYLCQNSRGERSFKDTPCNTDEKLLKKLNISDTINRYFKKTYSHTDQNLVKNPSFENRLTDWNAQQQVHWEEKLGLNDTGGVRIQAKKLATDKYIHETTIKQCVVLNAGTRYKLVANVRLNTIPPKKFANRANLYWYESANCSTGGQFGNYLEPENKFGWQTLVADNLTPAMHAKAAQIILAQNSRYSNGSRVLWDDILLVATEFKPKTIATDRLQYTRDAGINYLINGAFNAKFKGWRISNKTEWSQSIGHTEPGSARVTRHSNSGSNGSGAFSQCVNIGEKTKFELGASFKNDNLSTASGNGRLRLTWYQDLNCKGPAKTDTNWKDPESIDGWQKLQITGLVAPQDSQSAVIEIIQAIHEEGYFYAYWDDIYFRATP